VAHRLRIPSIAAYKRLKANREGNMTPGSFVYCICKESRKNKKSNDEKDDDNQKK